MDETKLLKEIALSNERLLQAVTNEFKQVESLLSLLSVIRPRFPLPETRGWAASPDFLKKISEVVLARKPKMVLEAGSGVSTLVTAYCLRETGGGKIYSLEHDSNQAAVNRELLSLHGLHDIATIVYAPLKEIPLGNTTWQWYDVASLELGSPIDFFIIDGPPAQVQRLARYPALPLFYDRLREGAIIFLDDAYRDDERKAVELWAKEFPRLAFHYFKFEKGAVLMRKAEGGKETHASEK